MCLVPGQSQLSHCSTLFASDHLNAAHRPLSLIIFAQPEQQQTGLVDWFAGRIYCNCREWDQVKALSAVVALSSSSCGHVNPIACAQQINPFLTPDRRDVRLNVLACTRKGTTVGVVDEGGEGGGRRQTYKSGQLSQLNDFNCFPANCNRSRRIECLSPTMYRLPSVWWTIERRHVLVLYLLILDEF